jgi:major membrane immunogen (membrane-anchored lipoprotein)
MEMAAKEKPLAVTLKDGVYEVVGEPDAKGYTSQVILTVEGGKVTAVVWDCANAEGKLKSTMSQNGEYEMTEDGATWYEQAQLLAQNVIENQGVSALEMNADGKTDAIASVSITIDEFVSQVEEALLLSASGETPVVEEPTTEEPTTEEPITESPAEIDGTKVDAISGATISTKAFLTAINNAYDYLVNNVVE